MSAGNDSREDTARESGSESDTDSRSGDEPTQSPRPRVRYTGGAPRFASETGGISRDAVPAQRSRESMERDAQRARVAAAEAAAARAAAAAAAATQNAQTAQAPSPSAAERTHEVRERLIRAVTNILNPLVNPPPLQEQCVVTLHTMVKNVADHPTDPKYRRVKASSRSITQKVVACRGGEEFLTAAGWRKVAIDYEAYLTCESTVPMDTLRAAEDVLAKHLTLCREKTERHTRNKTKDKDDAARCKEEAKRAIEEDKARRREAEERKKAAKAAAS